MEPLWESPLEKCTWVFTPHFVHIWRGFIEPLMTIHGLLRAETLELLVDVRTTWEACSSAESHDPLLHTLTQGVWVESKELLQMTILRKTVVRVPGFPGRKPICAFQNVPFSYSYETKESLNLIYTSCNLPSNWHCCYFQIWSYYCLHSPCLSSSWLGGWVKWWRNGVTCDAKKDMQRRNFRKC